MTPRSGVYRTRHSTKMRCSTNKTSDVSAVQVKLLVRYILLSTVGRQLVRTLGLNCSLNVQNKIFLAF
jgi:hypothetical protein